MQPLTLAFPDPSLSQKGEDASLLGPETNSAGRFFLIPDSKQRQNKTFYLHESEVDLLRVVRDDVAECYRSPGQP